MLGSECAAGVMSSKIGTVCQACYVGIVKGLKAVSQMETFRTLDGTAGGEGTVGSDGLLWGEGREEFGTLFG